MHRAIRSVVAQFSDNNLVARPFPDGVRGHSRGGMGIGSRAEKRGEEKGHQDIHDSIFHERAFLRGAKNGVAMMSSEVFGVPRRGKLQSKIGRIRRLPFRPILPPSLELESHNI